LPETRRRPADPPTCTSAEALQRCNDYLHGCADLILVTIPCICTTGTLPSASLFRQPATRPRPPLELALHVLEDLGDVVLGELHWSAISPSRSTSSGPRAVSHRHRNGRLRPGFSNTYVLLSCGTCQHDTMYVYDGPAKSPSPSPHSLGHPMTRPSLSLASAGLGMTWKWTWSTTCVRGQKTGQGGSCRVQARSSRVGRNHSDGEDVGK
jgi:hypothetical protein